MSVSRIITSMTFATVGLIFAAVSIGSLTLSFNHALLGSFRQAAGLVADDHRTLFALICGGIVLMTVATLIFPGFAFRGGRTGHDPAGYGAPAPWSPGRALPGPDDAAGAAPGRLHRAAAILGAVGVFGITALGTYGWRYAHFLPSPEAGEWVARYGLMLRAGVFVALGLIVALYPVARGRRLCAWRGGIRLALIVAMAVPAWLAPMALTRGLPSLAAASLSGSGVGAVEVVVVERLDNGRSLGCERAAVALPIGKNPAELQVCGIPEVFWTGLKAGDFLRLSGLRTGWGLQYLGYEITN